jgi:hypothetical protein
MGLCLGDGVGIFTSKVFVVFLTKVFFSKFDGPLFGLPQK